MTLSECLEGKKAIVSDLLLDDNQRKRVMDLGLLPGTEVQVVRKMPLGGPLVVQFRGYQIGLRVAEAKRIQIQAVS